MKNIAAVVFVACLSFVLMSYTEAYPTFGELEVPEIDVFAVDPYDDSDVYQPERAGRYRRYACEQRSSGALAAASCVAHCKMQGYKSGRCKNVLCHCYNDSP